MSDTEFSKTKIDKKKLKIATGLTFGTLGIIGVASLIKHLKNKRNESSPKKKESSPKKKESSPKKKWRPMKFGDIIKSIPEIPNNLTVEQIYEMPFYDQMKLIHGNKLVKMSKKVLKDMNNKQFYGFEGWCANECVEDFISDRKKGSKSRSGSLLKMVLSDNESFRIFWYSHNNVTMEGYNEGYYVHDDNVYAIGRPAFPVMGFVEFR
jgi:hypothetical protein